MRSLKTLGFPDQRSASSTVPDTASDAVPLTRRRDRVESRWIGVLVLVGFLAIVGYAVTTGQYFNWSLILIYGIFALGTSVPIGWSGLPAFGQGLFFAIGAYTMAFGRNLDLPSVVLQLAGVAIAAIAGVLIAVFVTGMPFIALSMMTMIVSQAVYQFAYTSTLTGGENGLYGIGRGDLFGISLGDDRSFWWATVGILVVLVLLFGVVRRSAWGRKVLAVKLDPVRAGSLGVRVRPTRVATFAIGAAVCGLAGVLYAQLLGTVDPSITFWTASAVAVVMVVVGGVNSVYGAVAGGMLYQWLTLWLNARSTSPNLWLGIVLVLVVLVAPGGLADIARRILRWILRAAKSRRAGVGESA